MANETSNPPVSNAPEAPATIETFVVEFKPGVAVKVTEQQKTKGRGAGKLVYGFADASILDVASKIIGAENWNKTLVKLLNRALNDAAIDAANKNNGNVSDAGLAVAFPEQFTAATRKHGEHIAQLREKRDEITAELQPLMVAQLRGEKLSDQQKIDLISLMERWETVVSQIEAKERKGKKTAPVA